MPIWANLQVCVDNHFLHLLEILIFLCTNLIGSLNDFWKYRVNDSTWTWVSGSNTINQPGIYGEKGISSRDNHPGARRYALGWYDGLNQEFWLFSGQGYGNSTTNEGVQTIISPNNSS